MGGIVVKIRVLQGFSDYTPGQVFDDWPDGMCEVLVARGLIEQVADNPAPVEPSVETAEVEAAVERADASPRRRRK